MTSTRRGGEHQPGGRRAPPPRLRQHFGGPVGRQVRVGHQRVEPGAAEVPARLGPAHQDGVPLRGQRRERVPQGLSGARVVGHRQHAPGHSSAPRRGEGGGRPLPEGPLGAPDQVERGERLGQEHPVGEPVRPPQLGHEPGDEHHRHARPVGPHPGGQLAPVHPGHHQVGHQQVRGRTGREQRQRRLRPVASVTA
jgi:hypothetical protein